MKRIFNRPIVYLSAMALVSAAIMLSPQTPTYANAPTRLDTDRLLSREVMPLAGNFRYENVNYGNHSAHKAYSVGTRRSQNNDVVLRFEVRAGENAFFDPEDRDRSEATDQISFPKNEVIWNAYRVKIAKGFSIPSGEKSWFIIGQWHGSVSDKRSPYIAAQMDGNDLVFLRRFLVDGKPKMQEMHRVSNVPRDQWLNIVIKHRVSETDGILDIWMNGRELVDFNGPLGYWDHADGGYWKFGIYRSRHDQDAVVEYRDVLTTTNDLSKRAAAVN